MNFDGASKGNLGRSRARCVGQDHVGEVVSKCRIGLGIATNNLVEAHATLLAVQMAKRLGMNKIQLEGDSKIITKEIAKGEAMHW